MKVSIDKGLNLRNYRKIIIMEVYKMYSISTSKNNIKVYYDNRLKFVTKDINKALHFITTHNSRFN